MESKLCFVLPICTFVFVLVATTANAQCDITACPANYQPVCGKARKLSQYNQFEFRSFPNQCEFEAEQCRSQGDRSWEFVSAGQCGGVTVNRPERSCDTSCAANYSPVCGRNRNGELRTFSNRCRFTVEKCKNPAWAFESEGQCLPTVSDSCNKFCIADYRPVCGRNGNEMKTFPNRCSFTNEQCKFSAWAFVRDGQCPTVQSQCDTVCAADYRPVCGRSGTEFKTFPNRCSFSTEQCKSSAWTFVRDGQCPSQPTCDTFCPADFRPVCGRNGNEMRTFPNQCSLNNEQCKSPTWKYVRDGQCPSTALSSYPTTPKPCNSFCSADFRPVCGRSGNEMKTFSNRCNFNNEQCKSPAWTFIRDGQCLSSSLSSLPATQPCNSYCAADYRPVCGRSGNEMRTFSNRCNFNNEQCRSPAWTFIRDGQCVSTTPTPTRNCNSFCSADYRPVCGRSGNEMRTFSNRCNFNNEQCRSPAWTFIRDGQCVSTTPTPTRNCNSFCSADYRPVCGRSGNEMKTFSNRCNFNNEQCKSPGWTFVRDGQCFTTPSPLVQNCNSYCTADYTPVCGRSGGEMKTFSNRCHFLNEQCKSPAWTFVRDGQCLNIPTPPTRNCDSFCSDDYRPVCGRRGTEMQTFSNRCSFNNEQCRSSAWTFVREGQCFAIPTSTPPTRNCDSFCSDDYRPVCGRRGTEMQTFPNRCSFNNEQCRSSAWTFVRDGQCFAIPTSTPPTQNCNSFCSADYRPVCGRSGSEMRTFSNRCNFLNEQCRSPAWTLVRDGQCISTPPPPTKNCNSFCSADFRPVCGRSGSEMKTFPNRCNFLNEQCRSPAWTFVRDGQCITSFTTSPTKTCNTFCTENYEPVCGRNGNDMRTFSNQCKLSAEQCRNPGWRLINNGICSNSNTIAKPCSTVCALEYVPVCAISGYTETTFQNRCALEVEQCLNPGVLTYAYGGSCASERNEE